MFNTRHGSLLTMIYNSSPNKLQSVASQEGGGANPLKIDLPPQLAMGLNKPWIQTLFEMGALVSINV